MPRLVIMLATTLLLASMAACSGDPADEATSRDIAVVATTSQIGALVHEVGTDLVDLKVLVGAGVDPHDYAATPADLRAIGEADVILKNGLGLDAFLDDLLVAAGGDAEVHVVTEGITLIEGGHAHDDEDDHDHDHSHNHGEFDPHVWHDPANARVMVDNIVTALRSVDPDNAATYEANGAAYKQVLDDTDADIRELIDAIPPENRKLVTTHDAFGYFIHAYGLEFTGAVIPGLSTDAEPSAQDLAGLAEAIEREGVRAIFVEDTVDPRIAEQLASDTGVEVVYGLYSDSLGEPGSGAETVHGMLLANATTISEALR